MTPETTPGPTSEALAAAVVDLRDVATVRTRCAAITQWVADGHSAHFTLDRSALPALAQRVATLTRSRFPTLVVPGHSRWRHFEAGGVDRAAALPARMHSPLGGDAANDRAELARARIDLAVVSVLLDAGAGAAWQYTEPGTGLRLARSEGLGVASWHAFVQGRFSSRPDAPCRVDAPALQGVDAGLLADVFQAGPHNPLLGLEGRADLLRRLGAALAAQPARFGAAGRPGHLFDHWAAQPGGPSAAGVLRDLLDAFSGIWPQGQRLHGVPLGDAWPHPQAGRGGHDSGPGGGWVPFHKLSQWLAYSLLEPLAWAGLPVREAGALTGLPEYRNGGLLLDGGALVPRDPAYAQRARTPGEPWVVEWRALTVTLLDELAPMVRAALGPAGADLSLAALLEGGTWAAGRQIAAERRPGGPPPVAIASDGTVF